MKRTKNYGVIAITTDAGKSMKICRKITGHEDWAWKAFRAQIKKWIRERGYPDAEARFVLNYIQEAKVVPEEERGLTSGMVFTFKGSLYWDRSYETASFLDHLLEGGVCWLTNAGEATL